MSQTLSYLALGDSYTIGEAVAQENSFPYQLVRLLVNDGLLFSPPVVIAKTGWTTDELQAAIADAKINDTFNLVTLLIGVNNQYRGRDLATYAAEYEELLKQAIAFANDNENNVFVLAIPDWSATPFAQTSGRDLAQIEAEIAQYNAAKKAITQSYGIHFIDICPSTKEGIKKPSLLANDGLHPSAEMYALWAQQVAKAITENRI